MKRTVLVAVLLLAIATLHANEPSGRWELTETLSYEAYREGKLLTFHGHCDVKFLRPDINDFRLERLSPAKTWIPMLFGRGWELDRMASMEMTDFHLYLKCPGASQRIWHQESGIQLFARTWIEPNASYRMTWSRRHPQRAPERYHVEFEWGGEDEADEKRPAFPQRAYLCEVLYNDGGVQFLGRTIRPPLHGGYRRHEMPAIGFDNGGQPVDPPDPAYQRIKHAMHEIVPLDHTKPKPPPARTTPYVGFSLDGNTVNVHVSDVGTSAQLPQEPGKPTFVMFDDNLYRIELLTKNIEVLRQDRDFWQQRRKQIREEWAKESRR